MDNYNELYTIISEKEEISGENDECACTVTLSLEPKFVATPRQFLPLNGLSINFCDKHNFAESDLDDYKAVTRKLARKIWLEDKDAKFKPEYRELFELVGDDF